MPKERGLCVSVEFLLAVRSCLLSLFLSGPLYLFSSMLSWADELMVTAVESHSSSSRLVRKRSNMVKNDCGEFIVCRVWGWEKGAWWAKKSFQDKAEEEKHIGAQRSKSKVLRFGPCRDGGTGPGGERASLARHWHWHWHWPWPWGGGVVEMRS